MSERMSAKAEIFSKGERSPVSVPATGCYGFGAVEKKRWGKDAPKLGRATKMIEKVGRL